MFKTGLSCKIFGHKWDKTNKNEQPCKRHGCKKIRVLMFSRYKMMMGDKSINWKIL